MEEKLAPEWRAVLAPEFGKEYFGGLLHKLRRTAPLPSAGILRAFRLTDLSQVKVLILGQDPYFTPGQATGLAFGVPSTYFPKPPTLINIFREVERNIGRPLDYERSTLEGWAAQGVLLLNTVLTTEPGKPMAHKGWGWERFVEQALLALAARNQPLVVMLWGAYAQKYESMFDGHCVLKSTHPSPNSANVGPISGRFVGCRHFEKANLFLESKGVSLVDWSIT